VLLYCRQRSKKAGAVKVYLVLKIILPIIIQEDADLNGRALQGAGMRAACLLGLRVRIPPRAWISVSCECCVLSLSRTGPSSGGVPPTVVRETRPGACDQAQ
jgi:hypothetical protein